MKDNLLASILVGMFRINYYAVVCRLSTDLVLYFVLCKFFVCLLFCLPWWWFIKPCMQALQKKKKGRQNPCFGLLIVSFPPIVIWVIKGVAAKKDDFVPMLIVVPSESTELWWTGTTKRTFNHLCHSIWSFPDYLAKVNKYLILKRVGGIKVEKKNSGYKRNPAYLHQKYYIFQAAILNNVSYHILPFGPSP